MKILIIQEKGRHPGNAQYREALSISRALELQGAETIVWGLNYDNFEMPFDEISRNCDATLLLENYSFSWLPDISKFKGTRAFWSIDSHLVVAEHVALCRHHEIDVVLNAIESHSKYFSNHTCRHFPNAYPCDLIDHNPNIVKSFDVGFCGNWANRRSWIESIKNIKTDIMVIGDRMVEAINSYKIHFNRNIADDVNYRTHETLGCKTFLLTNRTENLDRLFEIGVHLDTYETPNDLKKKIRYYLNNPEHIELIAHQGYEHVRSHHSFRNRAKRLIQILEEL